MKICGKKRFIYLGYHPHPYGRGLPTDKVEEPSLRGGNKPLYIDLGVVNLATVWPEGLKKPTAFSGGTLLSDWWYWTRRISKEQSRVAKINKAKTSRKIRRLYRIRQKRFRYAVNAMIKTIVEDAHELGVTEIVLGRLKGIRNNNYNHKANAMVNNFWSFEHIIRFKEKAEEYGIKAKKKSEHKTSSAYPFCNSENIKIKGRLFKCLNCQLEAHRDAVGVLNIGCLRLEGSVNGVVAHPLLLRWNGMKWEPKRAMNNRPMISLEARISRL
ncbi:MAG: transposase [Candidatus Methanomethylicaceae archaeon]